MIVKCRAPRRRPRHDGDTCDGFVARLPFDVMVCALPKHSDDADPDHLVAPCTNCGTLHEMQRVGEDSQAA